MHLEIRERRKTKKYYLAHSFRKDKKVLKIRVYLGVNLSKKELNEKRKAAEQEMWLRIEERETIHDPYVTALSSSELRELKTLEARGGIEVLHLSELDWDKFTEAFTYDTNAIEGSRVEAKEVVQILEKREWPQNRTREEIAEIYGVAEAVGHIRNTKEQISLALIRKLHEIVFRNSKSFSGGFRGKGTEVVIQDGLGKVVHRGAPSEKIEKLLKRLVRWYDKNKKKHPPIVLAAVVHNQFESIHPFQDGNGRVGRLLLNNILLKHNLPPLNIELKKREEYYAALQSYQKKHNIRPMIELMLREYKALKKMLKR